MKTAPWVELKKKFVIESELTPIPKHLLVAVLLPTGAIEIIHDTEMLEAKIKCYTDQYDEQFRLKTNPDVRIVDYMIV